MMRVLVCGGRDWTDSAAVYTALDRLHKRMMFEIVIEGDARGVDRMAGYWARKNRLENQKFPANWRIHGKAAGPIRNRLMLKEGNPALVVAFPGGRGTADMVALAHSMGVRVIEPLRPDRVIAAGARR